MTQGTRRLYWSGILAMAAVVAAYAYGHDLYGLYFDHQDSTQKVQSLNAELQASRLERTLLERQVEYLDTSPLEMEAAIRRSKNLVRAGEMVYRVKLPEDALE